ncbi:MAG: hypothetical protein Q9166_006487 [cf. Caloplaca sp. 2 TL-2023]
MADYIPEYLLPKRKDRRCHQRLDRFLWKRAKDMASLETGAQNPEMREAYDKCGDELIVLGDKFDYVHW